MATEKNTPVEVDPVETEELSEKKNLEEKNESIEKLPSHSSMSDMHIVNDVLEMILQAVETQPPLAITSSHCQSKCTPHQPQWESTPGVETEEWRKQLWNKHAIFQIKRKSKSKVVSIDDEPPHVLGSQWFYYMVVVVIVCLYYLIHSNMQ